MRGLFNLVVVAASALVASASAQATTCPPADYRSKAVFNPAKYFDGRWYAIQQIPVTYQPENELFCVTADYTIETTKLCQLFRCNETVVRVDNGANKDSVTGTRKTAGLNGLIKDLSKPAEASVGPRFLPSLFYGPYWVIEAGSYDELLADNTEFTSENYEWAIITVGAPEVKTSGGCLPGTGAFNGEGFWLFSRKAVVSQDITDRLVKLAASKGLDVTALKIVPQEGCKY
ncbi:hypothetical protein Poli38472_008147 [Pythium oligandrum]|uniref:Apolipoprotein D and lipocalin family protein n=1 Tax=Pythium oligandrum TaxID=41045 RepID=A0A8K1FIY6_PYTOL|nr:hypothetical protein Poli38472_008147 [Pythium oligandrum]|eukprot:TMW65505.1 hypothetical protein Poli38472_008147 [Pythium oligandrum]